MRFNQAPESAPDGMLPDNFADKVMHAQFKLANSNFLISTLRPSKR